MELLASVDDLPAERPFVLTIGVFDGVHRGHQRDLSRTVAAAHQLDALPVALTFEPHPAAVLRGSAPPLLCDPEERLAHMERAGLALTIVQRFDRQFASQSAEEFLQRLARGRLLAGLVMTPETAFGRNREGTLEAVQKLADTMGFELVQVEPLVQRGLNVSSTRVRELLARGRLGQVRQLLGRPFAVVGQVVTGDHRGRELGYPTANLAWQGDLALPPDGIYAVRVSWGGKDLLAPLRREDGVASLGVRPTFGGSDRILEVHIFDIDEGLYGQRLRVEFIRRQRGERRFADAKSLIRQMDRDASRARAILTDAHARL